MRYERIPYLDPGARYESVATLGKPFNVPVFDYPISPRENFQRVLRHDHPRWVPNSVNDFNFCMARELTGLDDLRFDLTGRSDWTDMFGCEWEFVPLGGRLDAQAQPPPRAGRHHEMGEEDHLAGPERGPHQGLL